MKYRLITKYAVDNSLVKPIRGWKDSEGNVCVVFEISGKKYSFIKPSSESDWHYWMGIGSERVTRQMPAGRGDYFVGPKIDPLLSQKFTDVINQGVSLDLVNTAGASWSPTDEAQLQNLSNLIAKSSEINEFLSQHGLLYTGSDKIIFGDDIKTQDILSAQINRPITKKIEIPIGGVAEVSSNQPSSTAESDSNRIKTDESTSSSAATGNTPNTEKFIEEIKKSYKEKFGKELHIGSTYRTPLDQARAMRDPLAVGDYDGLYGTGEKASQVKKLISTKRDEDLQRAAEIVATMDISPHMKGRGIDIPFRKNDMSGRDYSSFSKFISEVSQRTGISAKLNSEKKTHFHITVSK